MQSILCGMSERRLDPASLKALAHPLRADLFRALREAPATSAQLARRFDHNTGTVSWHLRQLALAGLIVDDPGHGDGRERWWRAEPGNLNLDIREHGIRDDVAAMEAARWYAHDAWRRVYDRLTAWVETAERWSSRWIGASVLSEQVIHLTPEQLRSLQDDLNDVVDRYRAIADGGSQGSGNLRAVQVAFQAFPLGEPDGD